MQTTHDPPEFQSKPGTFYSDDAVLRSRERPGVRDEVRLIEERARLLGSPTYQLLASKLHEEPMNLIRDMAEGRYRWRRTRNRMLALGVDGEPQPDFMSFRSIEVELSRVTGGTGVPAYETLRRWWDRVWPPPPDGPDTPTPDVHGGILDLAHREAAAVQTNTGVPPAAFLPPAAA